jgi:hypothetical protein
MGSAAKLPGHPSQNVIRRQTGIIVEKKQQFPFDQAHAGVATSWDSEILRQPFGLYAGRQTHRLPPISHNDNIEVHVPLPQQTGKTMMQILRPIAHGQDDNRELWPHRRAHRSLEDASTAIRCPINVKQAATTSAASNTFVAAPATKRSTMAAISTRIDNSTEWKTR